jgi:Eukaryotic membrane protein family
MRHSCTIQTAHSTDVRDDHHNNHNKSASLRRSILNNSTIFKIIIFYELTWLPITCFSVSYCTCVNAFSKRKETNRGAQHSTAQHSTAQHSTAQHSTAQHSTAQHSTVKEEEQSRATMSQEILHRSAKIEDSTNNDGSVVGLPNSNSTSEDEDTQAGIIQKETTSWESIPHQKKADDTAVPCNPDLKQDDNKSSQDDHVLVGDKQEDQAIEPPREPAMETTSLPPEESETIIPTSHNNDNHTPSILLDMEGSTRVTELSLEERVQELETKLATLSRILQQQQRLSAAKNLVRTVTHPFQTNNASSSFLTDMELQLIRSPSNSQRNLQQASQKFRLPGMPPLEDLELQYDDNSGHDEERSPVITRTNQKGMVPYLESPAPIEDPSPRQRSLHQRKRLSFHLLYDGNEDNLARADDDAHVSIMSQRSEENNQYDSFHTDTGDGEGHPLHNNNISSNNPLGTSNGSELITTDSSAQSARRSTTHASSAAAKEAIAARVIAAQAKADGMGDSSHQNSVESSATDELAAGTPSRLKAAILPPMLLSKDKRSKWLDHLNSFQESNHDVDIQMQEFIKVPGAVEKTLTSGFLICVDSFLYVCTILPIRFAWSLVLLSLHYFFKWTKKPAGKLQFHRRYEIGFIAATCRNRKLANRSLTIVFGRHTYQLIQVFIILFIYTYILLPISIGKLYHWIRGQAMIKLYVLIAIVEVFDRLMCSLGQDCLDSMYWNTTRRPRSARMVISVSVVIVYTAVHSLILFIHVCTLSV